MADLTDNDRRVLDAVDYAQSQWDGFIPHGASEWTAIRRLVAARLIERIGDGECQTCEGDEPHEGPIYRLVGGGAWLTAP